MTRLYHRETISTLGTIAIFLNEGNFCGKKVWKPVKMMENGKIRVCYESNDALYLSLIFCYFFEREIRENLREREIVTVCSIALWVDFLFPFRNTTVFITKVKKYLANGEAFRN